MVQLGKLRIRLEEIDAYIISIQYNRKKTDFFKIEFLLKNGRELTMNCVTLEEVLEYIEFLDNHFFKQV